MRRFSEREREITDRFFLALDTVIASGRIRGLQTFTRMHGLNQGNVSTLKNHRERCGLKPEMLSYLAEDFGVSCEWLLTGRGEMFT